MARHWMKATSDLRCGGTACAPPGAPKPPIREGSPVLVITKPGWRRALYRCERCAGESAPNVLPEYWGDEKAIDTRPVETIADSGFTKVSRALVPSDLSQPVAAKDPLVAKCEVCRDLGWVSLPGQIGHRDVRRCDCQRASIRPGDLPSVFLDARLSNYQAHTGNRHALAAANEFLAGGRRDLYFVGGTGVGKTRLACSILNERPDRALFVRVPRLVFAHLQGIHDEDKRGEANQWIDRCLAAELLVLDDIAGGEKGSDFSRAFLVMLYDERVDRNRRTIWTSNLTPAQLSDFYGDARLPSRILGRCGEALEIGGDDRRVTVFPAPGERRRRLGNA